MYWNRQEDQRYQLASLLMLFVRWILLEQLKLVHFGNHQNHLLFQFKRE